MEKIADNVWKLNADSNIYFLDLERKIIIDAGPSEYKDIVVREIKKVVDPAHVDLVIFTHLHYDHIGNFDIFTNAKFYASRAAISIYKNNKLAAILDPDIASVFNVDLHPLIHLEGFDIIDTPGHTKESFCLFYKKEKILFSGDTLFLHGYGRIDLPTSTPDKMDKSLEKLKKIKYKLLAPGHDY
jgi:hydroxyacylglutathione hydrolase